MGSSDTSPSLFTSPESRDPDASDDAPAPDRPLAFRMRPRDFDEFVNQEHAVGSGTPLRKALEADRLSSLIVFGPPGTGKTALARIIARNTSAHFERLNAVLCGKDDLREVIHRAEEHRDIQNRPTILFLDEIHRFNKAQQDALLPSVEDGTLTLVGATTQNPYFYLNNALLSRSILVEFEPLDMEALERILDWVLSEPDRGLQGRVELSDRARRHLVESANGDARRLLNGLEIAAKTSDDGTIGLEQVEDALQEPYIQYDREDDQHYDVASAFIKSIRGSDPDAAVYYLAKMLEAGEDPRFIARRLVIAASEDVGNADPGALNLAVSALNAVEFVGLPEAQIPLAQATTYLAASPKSNAAYRAIGEARQAVREGLDLPVPAHLRDSHYQGARDRGHGVGYDYPHDFPNHYVPQQYLDEEHTFYEPTEQGREKHLKAYLESLRTNEADSGPGSTD